MGFGSIVVFDYDLVVYRWRLDIRDTLLTNISKDDFFGLVGFVGYLVELLHCVCVFVCVFLNKNPIL